MRHFLQLTPLLVLMILGNFTRATAEDPAIAGILGRLDRLEGENQELRQENRRLENLFNEEVSRQPAPQDEPGSPLHLHHFISHDYSADSPADQADPGKVIIQLGAGMEQLQSGMEQLGAGVEELGKNLTVTTANKEYGSKIAFFGALSGELMFAEKRPIIPGAITQISPDFGNDSQRAEVHAKSSYLGAAVIGPQVGSFQVGGLALAYFYGENVLDDLPGLFLARLYGELKNDFWRFSIGLDGDLVVPLAPTTVNWSIGNGAGNMGYQRAQFRVERYICPYANSQWTLQFALTDPTVTSYANFNVTEGLQEDNGWPNLEGRVAWGYGPRCELAGEQKRAIEVGLSGVVGELRRTTLGPPAIADVWAYGFDAQVRLSDRLGVKGEVFNGQTIGTYNAAIVQNFNANREGIRASGGWGEVYFYWTPCLHSHFGYSIDNPRDSDLTAGLTSRNEFVFGNIFWDVTRSIEVGFEVSHWETAYIAPLQNNDSMIYHTRVAIKF
jgi:X-X-X-Leu-X-X-Gly heptad repeat protein